MPKPKTSHEESGPLVRLTRQMDLTFLSVLALAAALLLGAVGQRNGGHHFETLRLALVPVGTLFVGALRVIVIPLVVTLVLSAMVGQVERPRLGLLGLRALGLFLGMLIMAGLFALAVAPGILAFVPVDAASIQSIRAATVVPEAALSSAPLGFNGGGLEGLLPGNLLKAIGRGELLPILLLTLLIGAAIQHLPENRRAPLAVLIHSSAKALHTLIHWVLWLTPLGVFALAYVLGLRTGLRSAGLIGAFILAVSLPMLALTALLYPLTAFMGRVKMRDFARAAAPAQLVAVGTRSSLAALPALVEGGRQHLGLGEAITGFVLPLSVSTFKVNRTLSAVMKLLFLAHVFGFQVPPARMALFILTVIILSFTAIGLPGGGGAFKSLPAYLAAGAPIEGIVILEAADAIPDIFKTLLNVTGDMAAAAILSRDGRVDEAV